MHKLSSIDVEAVSGICGSVSIACWVVVFSPQIIENFRRRSAEGLSLAFLIIWLAGDVFNILGAVLQGVLPTMVRLASAGSIHISQHLVQVPSRALPLIFRCSVPFTPDILSTF